MFSFTSLINKVDTHFGGESTDLWHCALNKVPQNTVVYSWPGHVLNRSMIFFLKASVSKWSTNKTLMSVKWKIIIISQAGGKINTQSYLVVVVEQVVWRCYCHPHASHCWWQWHPQEMVLNLEPAPAHCFVLLLLLLVHVLYGNLCTAPLLLADHLIPWHTANHAWVVGHGSPNPKLFVHLWVLWSCQCFLQFTVLKSSINSALNTRHGILCWLLLLTHVL